MIYVIGCGGESWSVEPLHKLLVRRDYEPGNVLMLIDGDTIEEHNLDRQLYDEDDIGKNKAQALSEFYENVTFLPDFFYNGMLREKDICLESDDILWCGVDNHPGRREVLACCDENGCSAVIAANEYTDSEAYWYDPAWKNTPNDPRVFYPTILTSQGGDPLAPRGCVGEAQEHAPQLVLANVWASALALHLYWFHTHERQKVPMDQREFMPVHHKVSKWKWTTIRFGDRK